MAERSGRHTRDGFAFHTRPYTKSTPPDVLNGVHRLYGRDGFRTYCAVCDKPAGPLRSTFQAAVYDQLTHRHANPRRGCPCNGRCCGAHPNSACSCRCGGANHNPSKLPRKKKRPTGSDWQPDLFGGQGIQRREGLTRADQLELARQEMRDSGARDLFDFEREQNPRRRAATTRRRNPDTLGWLAIAAVVWWWGTKWGPIPTRVQGG